MKRPDGDSGVGVEQRDRRWWALRVGLPLGALLLVVAAFGAAFVLGVGNSDLDVHQYTWDVEQEPGELTYEQTSQGGLRCAGRSSSS